MPRHGGGERRAAGRRSASGGMCAGHQVDQLPVEPVDAADRLAQPRGARTMVSNTGCTSVGDLAITRRISAVAVCCSSASFVSLNSRTFSMAITAWSAKVLT